MAVAAVALAGMLVRSRAGLAQAPPPASTLHTTSRLVVLDVVVEDRKGNPVAGLDASSFRVTEDKVPQSIHNFEPHTSEPVQTASPALPRLAPGYFIDYTPPAADDVLDVLLIDSLNTPPDQQPYLRQQLLKFLREAPKGRHIAIFGLRDRLVLLQGFTTDPELLRQAIDRKSVAGNAPLLNDVAASGSNELNAAGLLVRPEPASADVNPLLIETIDRLKQFEAANDEQGLQAEHRIQFTMDGLNALGRYLDGLPGHKNLVWFAASFPISLAPVPSLSDPDNQPQIDVERYRETVNLFTHAKVALYPVDAGGLEGSPDFDATSGVVAQRPAFDGFSQTGVRNDPSTTVTNDERFQDSRVQEHALMDALANSTGGHAFYNNNDLAKAATKAFDSGSHFYSLSYVPTDKRDNGKYRSIHVELRGAAAGRGYRLAYRRGYFADGHEKADHGRSATAAEESQQHAVAAYSRAAMAFGAPAPESILFETRILPERGPLDNLPAAGNLPSPAAKLKGPFRRFHIDFVALPDQFSLAETSKGRRTGGVEALAYLYGSDGKLLNIAGETLAFDMTPEEYAVFRRKPLHTAVELSVPDRRQTYVRVALRDVPSNRYGVIELPVAQLRQLPLRAAASPSSESGPPAAAAAKK